MSLILSIDVGTTNLKAGIVNEKGEVLALRRVQVPVIRPEYGAAEHDPKELYELIIAISREISKAYRHDIQHIVLSTYQLGLIILDEHQAPLTGMTLLSDMRARETFGEFKQKLDMPALYRRIACPPMVQCPLARIFYFQKRKPDILKRARYFLGCKDYLLLQLTGEIVTEPSIAGATQMFNLNTRKWDAEAMGAVGINEDQLPPVVDGMSTRIPLLHSVRKELRLSSPQIQVFPGVYDGGALSIGLSGLKEGIGVMNIGTSAMVRLPGQTPAIDPTEHMLLSPHCLAEGCYLNGGAINNATIPLNWMRDKICDVDFNNIPVFEKHRTPLFCLPYLTGERDSKIGPFANGVFFGLREYHGSQDLLRSAMEGVAYSLYQISQTLAKNSSSRMEELRVGGGGAASAAWMQIFADVFNIPVVLPKGEETALVGSAMIAYSDLGVFSSLADAVEKMTSVDKTIEPDRYRSDKYAGYYRFFEKLRHEVEPLYKEHAELFRPEA